MVLCDLVLGGTVTWCWVARCSETWCCTLGGTVLGGTVLGDMVLMV
jgi:hypothetical protein